MKNTLNQILNIGIKDKAQHEYKKVRLLNAFTLTWILCTIMFLIMDYVLDITTTFSLLVHCNSLISILFIFVLQHYERYTIARVLYLVMFAFSTFSFSFYIEPGRLLENGYFMIPFMALIFFEHKIINYSILIICWLLYFLPSMLAGLPTQPDPVFQLAIFAGSFIVFDYFKTINLKNEERLAEAYEQLRESKQNELAMQQLKSIKAQMNPHFLYNALNSVQSLILREQKDEAYRYLTKFSQQIREVLNMSEDIWVDFDKEITHLKNYLDLEKLRFSDNFTFDIETNNIENIIIPSMIIQPFMENAIKHGLLHKETNKYLSATFFIKDENVVICEIFDNGIGRKASKKINEQNVKKPNSFSVNAIEKQFTLLREVVNTEIGFEYQDFEGENGIFGTKVIIKMPYADYK